MEIVSRDHGGGGGDAGGGGTAGAHDPTASMPYAKLLFNNPPELLSGEGGLLIHKLPVLMGRGPAPDHIGQFVRLPGKTVSRRHALVRWDHTSRSYLLEVQGRNPVTVAGSKTKTGAVAVLANKTPVMIGTFKFYFLLPRPPSAASTAQKNDKDTHQKKQKKKKRRRDKEASAAASSQGNASSKGGAATGGAAKRGRSSQSHSGFSVGVDVDGKDLSRMRRNFYAAALAVCGKPGAVGSAATFTLREVRLWLVDNGLVQGNDATTKRLGQTTRNHALRAVALGVLVKGAADPGASGKKTASSFSYAPGGFAKMSAAVASAPVPATGVVGGGAGAGAGCSGGAGAHSGAGGGDDNDNDDDGGGGGDDDDDDGDVGDGDDDGCGGGDDDDDDVPGSKSAPGVDAGLEGGEDEDHPLTVD